MRIFIWLFLSLVLFADSDYDMAKKYLNAQIGAKYITVKVNSLNECADPECMEDFVEKHKKTTTTKKIIIDYKSAIKFLEKSYEKGNIKAGKEIVNLIKTKKELKNDLYFKKVKQKIEKRLKNPNSCYGRYLIADKIYKKDLINSYIEFKNTLNLCKKSMFEYKISKRKLELIEKKIEKSGFWSFFWFKIKLYIKIFINYIFSLFK